MELARVIDGPVPGSQSPPVDVVDSGPRYVPHIVKQRFLSAYYADVTSSGPSLYRQTLADPVARPSAHIETVPHTQSVDRFVSDLSEEQLKGHLLRRGVCLEGAFRGQMQKALVDILKYEQSYQQFYFVPSAPKRRRLDSPADLRTYSPSHNDYSLRQAPRIRRRPTPSPPRPDNLPETTTPLTPVLAELDPPYVPPPPPPPRRPRTLSHAPRRRTSPPLAQISQPVVSAQSPPVPLSDPELVASAPCGVETVAGPMRIVEGIVGDMGTERYLGGKGNARTPIPLQTLQLNSSHSLVRGRDPRTFIVWAFLLSHNKLNERMKVLARLGSSTFENVDGQWLSRFDSLVVRFSSHSNGPYLKLRFALFLSTSIPSDLRRPAYALDSHGFKTITKKGIKKRERKRQGIAVGGSRRRNRYGRREYDEEEEEEEEVMPMPRRRRARSGRSSARGGLKRGRGRTYWN